MTINQELLDEQMGTPPPSTVDIDAVIVRQRRRVRYRHTGLTLSAGAVTVAVALVLTMVPRAGTARPLTAGAPPVKPASTPAASPGGGKAATSPRDREAARLSGVLQQVMASTLPSSTFLPYSRSDEPTPRPLVFVDRGDYFSTNAAIKDSSGRGSIRLSIGRESDSMRLNNGCGDDPPPRDVKVQCKTEPGPGGATVMILSTERGNYKRHLVEILRSDGNSVEVEVSNGAGAPLVAQRPGTPLTTAQLIKIAENPDLATHLH
jgi:hypothetical protein